jgi:hypothetical protein
MPPNETKIAPQATVCARYSSDLQSAASIDDGLRTCTVWAAKEGLLAAGSYTRQGISGARLIPGATPDAGPVFALTSIKWLGAQPEPNMSSISAEMNPCLQEAMDHQASCTSPRHDRPGAAS